LDLDFLASGIDDTPSNLTWTWKCFLSIDWYQESLISLADLLLLGLLQSIAFWGTSRSGHRRIQHTTACFWISVDRDVAHCVSCKIWRWVVHLVSEKCATIYKKLGGPKRGMLQTEPPGQDQPV
jgi:hypothetical protein